jgi:hypothetical protein
LDKVELSIFFMSRIEFIKKYEKFCWSQMIFLKMKMRALSSQRVF